MKKILKYINNNINCDFKYLMYHKPYSMYSDREVCASSEDPDQTFTECGFRSESTLFATHLSSCKHINRQ